MIPPSLEDVLRLHADMRADLKTRLDALLQREQILRKELEECLTKRKDLVSEENALSTVEAMYRERFGKELTERALNPSTQTSDDTKKPKARIGTQRYLMWDAIRNKGGIAEISIVFSTGLSPKRVREQMVSDVQQGFVQHIGGVFRLTDAGIDLMNRFEAYRKSQGKELPKRGDADEDDNDSEEFQNASESQNSTAPEERKTSTDADFDFLK